jgi:transcriptional regulator MraZ
MFLGEHEHTLDQKGRLTLPAKYRDSFPEGLVLSRGMDGCVFAYAKADWAELASRLAALDTLGRDDRMMKRHFFSGAAEVMPDRQGRVMIPTPLASHAKLDRDVVIAGVYDHLEIWDRAAWRAQITDVEGRAEDVAERLAAKRD